MAFLAPLVPSVGGYAAAGGAAAMYQVGGAMIVAVSSLYTVITGVQTNIQVADALSRAAGFNTPQPSVLRMVKDKPGVFQNVTGIPTENLKITKASLIAEIANIVMEAAAGNTTISKQKIVDLCGNYFVYTNENLLRAPGQADPLQEKLEQCKAVFEEVVENQQDKLGSFQKLINYLPTLPDNFINFLPKDLREWASNLFEKAKNPVSFGANGFANFQSTASPLGFASSAYRSASHVSTITSKLLDGLDAHTLLKMVVFIIILIPLILKAIKYFNSKLQKWSASLRSLFERFQDYVNSFYTEKNDELREDLKPLVIETETIAIAKDEQKRVDATTLNLNVNKKVLRSPTRRSPVRRSPPRRSPPRRSTTLRRKSPRRSYSRSKNKSRRRRSSSPRRTRRRNSP